MRRTIPVLLLSSLIVAPVWAQSPAVIDQLLNEYQSAGASVPDASAGEALYNREQSGRSCTSCHTPDPRAAGKHQRTGKRIEPLAPSANPERLTDERQIKKWFYRNCKWTLGRECTAQEKSDFLTWLRDQ
jgi:mono/diheme cytochrome c family protein